MLHRNILATQAILALGALMALTSCVGPPGIVPPTSPSEPAQGEAPSPTPSLTPTPLPTPQPITIDASQDEAVASVPLVVRGTANTFEATLVVDIVNQSGEAVCMRTVTATAGSGTSGSWEAMLAFPPPDANTPMTLRAYSLSAEDGSMQHLVERRVTVSANRPPIFLTSPVCGAVMTQPGEQFLVEGRAAVFEAALSVEFRDAAGAVRFSENLMTDVGNEESAFSAYLTLPEDTSAGLYDVVAFSYSALDGSIQDEFAVQVLVQP